MKQVQSRFITALALSILGALLGIGALLFTASTERWLGLTVSGAVLIVVLVGVLIPGRGTPQRILDLLALAAGAWALVSSRTIELAINGATPHLVKWLGLSAGAAIAGLGLIGLLAHELTVAADLSWAADRLRDRAGAHATARAEIVAIRATLAETEAALAEAEAEIHELRVRFGVDGELTQWSGSGPRGPVPGPLRRARAALHGGPGR